MTLSDERRRSAGAAPRTLRVAAVQMPSENGQIAANLARATEWVERAVHDGAELVLLPEFLSTGYIWTQAIWNAAEPKCGPTVEWLRATSRRLGIWLGTTYLEAEGSDFYNTFVLTGPDGAEAGRVRKQHPALWEAAFFRGEVGSHVIDTPLGRIGVGICYENYLAFLPPLLHRESVDLLLMPHSAPSPTESIPVLRHMVARFQADLQSVASHYANALGIPAIMVNKCGPWRSGLILERPANFPGYSAIVDGDGTVKARLDDDERVIVADVVLDGSRKAPAAPQQQRGRWARETSFGQTLACVAPETVGGSLYRMSLERRKRARAVSSMVGGGGG